MIVQLAGCELEVEILCVPTKNINFNKRKDLLPNKDKYNGNSLHDKVEEGYLRRCGFRREISAKCSN